MTPEAAKFDSLERELEQSRRTYKQLFEAVPSHICVLDRELRILEFNELYRRDFDVRPGAQCFEACKQRRTACPECLVARTFQDGSTHSSEETLTTRDGRRLDLVVHSMPIRDEDDRISAVMEVFTDITEVKRLQHELALMGRAVAGMAHRIKNILMGLEGGVFVANTGREANDEETMAQGWDMVERNVKTISRLVRDLLYCSKEREPEFQADVCLVEILKEVCAVYTKRTAQDRIQLVVDEQDTATPGRFDPDGVTNLVRNLVTNAIDACRFDPDPAKAEHRIVLRCRNDERGAAVIEVEDNGPGIPVDIVEKVFVDFFSTKGTEGTGVGLLVVQKVAEEHGGCVTFSTEEGHGTTFRVKLPQVAANDRDRERQR